MKKYKYIKFEDWLGGRLYNEVYYALNDSLLDTFLLPQMTLNLSDII